MSGSSRSMLSPAPAPLPLSSPLSVSCSLLSPTYLPLCLPHPVLPVFCPALCLSGDGREVSAPVWPQESPARKRMQQKAYSAARMKQALASEKPWQSAMLWKPVAEHRHTAALSQEE